MINKIAFIGGTGMLGRPVAVELLKSGFAVTALVRDQTKASMLPPSVKIIYGDIRNLNDLHNLFTEQDAVYINLNLAPTARPNEFLTEREGLGNVINAAKKAGLKRIAFISSIVMRYQGMNNFNWWVFHMKRNAVEMVKKSGIPYSIFYPSTFMENFDGNYRQGNNMMLAGKSEQKMYFISATDYGKQVARSFEILKNENREYVIQGPEAFTADDAVKEFVRYYSKSKLRIRTAPIGLLKFFSLFIPKLRYGWRIMEALNKYPEKFEAENTWEELGKPTITIRMFAESKSNE